MFTNPYLGLQNPFHSMLSSQVEKLAVQALGKRKFVHVLSPFGNEQILSSSNQGRRGSCKYLDVQPVSWPSSMVYLKYEAQMPSLVSMQGPMG
jgi:hypothetical protein